jgi:DedD protein
MEDKLEKLKKKNDLSDIILEKEGSSGDKIKKLLLGAASLVLLFLIVLIGMKMFNSSSVSPSEELANVGENISDKKVETATDGVVQSAKKSLNDIDTAADDSLFKSEAIIDEESETDLKFEEMVRKLKQQDAKDNQSSEASVKEADKALDDVFEAKKEETPSPSETATTNVETENVIDKI